MRWLLIDRDLIMHTLVYYKLHKPTFPYLCLSLVYSLGDLYISFSLRFCDFILRFPPEKVRNDCFFQMFGN